MISRRFSLSVWSPSKGQFVPAGIVGEATVQRFKERGYTVEAHQVECVDPAAERAAERAADIQRMARETQCVAMTAHDRLRLMRELRALAARHNVKLSLTEAGR